MFKQLDDQTLVSGQISTADLGEAKRLGVTTVINNRPDHEDEGQPTSAEIEAAADAQGLRYCHVPIARGMGPAETEGMRAALNAADGKVLAYCRSGNRSVLAWAVAKREDGADADELKRAAEAAGFSLAPIQHLM